MCFQRRWSVVLWGIIWPCPILPVLGMLIAIVRIEVAFFVGIWHGVRLCGVRSRVLLVCTTLMASIWMGLSTCCGSGVTCIVLSMCWRISLCIVSRTCAGLILSRDSFIPIWCCTLLVMCSLGCLCMCCINVSLCLTTVPCSSYGCTCLTIIVIVTRSVIWE